jgi:hypothetical protein
MNEMLRSLGNLSWAQAISEGTWQFPTIETIHVFAITTVIGSIMVVDLRLLNWASRNRSVREVIDEMLPWTWGGFVIAAITGALLFSSMGWRYVALWQYNTKMCMLLLAGINMLIFHKSPAYRGIASWDRPSVDPPQAVKTAGFVSLLLWTVVVIMGRWVGFKL